jgi:hypothetical protein
VKNSIITCTVALAISALTTLCCCPYFSFGESSDPKKDFERLVWSPMPPGVTPIAADYEYIGLGDGHGAVHFRVDTAELMSKIIEKHHLTKVPDARYVYADDQYPLEEWQTKPQKDEIECFEYIEYNQGGSEAVDYKIVLWVNEDHTEGLFKVIYY